MKTGATLALLIGVGVITLGGCDILDPDDSEFKVVMVDRMPEFLTRDSITYPVEARRDSATGRAIIISRIPESGKVDRAQIWNHSGWQVLDSCAERAARNDQYSPAIADGRAQSIWLAYSTHFNTDGSEFRVSRLKDVPQILVLPDIEYPEEARRKFIQGSVWMTIRINTDGSVCWARMEHSSGYRLLDSVAVYGALGYRFTSPRHTGEDDWPDYVWIYMPMRFVIE